MANVVRLGIAGLGTVAQGVLNILQHNHPIILARSGVDLRVTRVASRTAKRDVDLLGATFSTQLDSLYNSDDVDIVIELIGGETIARDLIEASLDAKKPVVTANKAVIANFGNQLLASNQRVPLKFEAAVAGAIPILQAIQQGLVANRFEHVVGIINGTCNYILTAMQQSGTAFDAALSAAQELGYAEADPTFDVEGIDAAHKLAILLALAYDTQFNFDDIYIEGISKISPADIIYAQELGYCIKHVGIARRSEGSDDGSDDVIEARVHPVLLPQDQLLANVNDVANAILIKSDAAGHTLFSGPGAGGAATASAVLSDVVDVAQGLLRGGEGHTTQNRAPVTIVPIAQVRSPHYLRIPTQDQPGVFAAVAQALSNHEISIEAAIQKQPSSVDEIVDIVILTGITTDAAIQAALGEVQRLPQMAGEIARIRVETLE